MANLKKPFWESKTLDEMNNDEWESLCDGCGKCCLIKLLNEDTEQIHYTSLACKLLDTESCRCSNYENRKKWVPDCLILRPLNPDVVSILPATCSYRLLYLGEELPLWHPLITGDKNSTNEADMSVAGKVISEAHIHPDDFENYLID